MSSDSPFPVSSTSGGGTSRRLDVDNLIRRELRVGDPGDAKQVAHALMQRYADTPTARSMLNEARGLPFLQAVALAPAPATAPTATNLDLQQARDDIEADLHELLTSNLLKDLVPELEGWAGAIRDAVDEGVRSAQLAIDTRQRDKTFAIRRQLGDYARAARLVGSFRFQVRPGFRNLAESLDEASAVLLVMMGEAIANTGIAGGRYLLQVPFSELQARREAVLYALRNLMGSTQYAYGPNDLPRGLDAYRKLLISLEEQGQGELRSLLTEAEVARVMDQLIDRAGKGVNGLRALAATAQIDIQRFERLLGAIRWNVDRTGSSPPLLALQEALHLFLDGFENSGGIRLVNIARPSILRYGLYRNRALGSMERVLNGLLEQRGNIAAGIDEVADCGCDPGAMRSLVLMDQGLYSVDRAIDLYCVGTLPTATNAEVRAVAHGQVVQEIATALAATPALAAFAGGSSAASGLAECGRRLLDVVPDLAKAAPDQHAWMMEELASLWRHEAEAFNTMLQMDGESAPLFASYAGCMGDLVQSGKPQGDVPLVLWTAFEAHRKAEVPPMDIHMPPISEASLAGLMEAKVQDVLLSSAVNLENATSLKKELEARTHEAENAIKNPVKGFVHLHVTADGEQSPQAIRYTTKEATEVLQRLHERKSAAETLLKNVRERKHQLGETLRRIPFRPE